MVRFEKIPGQAGYDAMLSGMMALKAWHNAMCFGMPDQKARA